MDTDMKRETKPTTPTLEVHNPSWEWLKAMMKVRRELGMTQEQFADAIGMSKDAVAAWECCRNRITYAIALRMSVRLGRNILAGSTEPVDGEAVIRAEVAKEAAKFERDLRTLLRF